MTDHLPASSFQDQHTEPPGDEGRDRILFVDDEIPTQRAFARAMEGVGMVVDIAEGIDEALQLATHHTYGVIATDLDLTTGSGLRLIEQLKKIQSHASYLLVTGASAEILATEGIASKQPATIVSKPWNNQELIDLVRLSHRMFLTRTNQSSPQDPKQAYQCNLLVVHVGRADIRLTDCIRGFSGSSVKHVHCIEDMKSALEQHPYHVALISVSHTDPYTEDFLRNIANLPTQIPLIFALSDQVGRSMRCQIHDVAFDQLDIRELSPRLIERIVRHAQDYRQSQERLLYLAFYDQLTGLANRRLFGDRVHHALAKARRHNQRIVVLLVDLDDFKRINDSLGMDAGDSLLTEVSSRLRNGLRDIDTVARLGGDEFAILLEDVEEDHAVVAIVKRIKNLLMAPIHLNGHRIVITASIGAAFFPENAESFDHLLQSAELAMYRAKRSGPDGFNFFSQQTHLAQLRRVKLESDLRIAIERREFILHYQPIFRLSTGNIVAVEALARWKHPGSDQLSYPDQFIPLLEDTGLILPFGIWALKQACSDLVAWGEIAHSVKLSANISARQLDDKNFVKTVETVLQETGLPAERLQLELTETQLLRDHDHVQDALQYLKDRGVRIAVDDFGVGHSSLSRLSRLPLDCLKIDKSFLRNVESPAGKSIVAAIIGMARGLELEITAEGVEQPSQEAYLREHQCDLVQGHFYARPIPTDALIEMLRQSSASTKAR